MKVISFSLIPLGALAGAIGRPENIKGSLNRRQEGFPPGPFGIPIINSSTPFRGAPPGGFPKFPKGLDSLAALTGSFDPTKLLPSVPVARVTQLRPQLRDDAVRVRIAWGPTTLLAANESAPLFSSIQKSPMVEGQVWMNQLPGMPADSTVLFGKIGLEYADGAEATPDTGTYNHHIQIMHADSKKIRKEYCIHENLAEAPRMGPQVMLGAGASDSDDGFLFTTPDATFNSGYLLGSNDRFLISGQVVNYKNHRVDIYPTFEVEYVKDKAPGVMDVSVMLVSVTGCDPRYIGNEFLPPPGTKSYNVTSSNLTMPESGYILNALGHIHDSGTNVISRINGRLICDSKATYGRANKQGSGHSHMGMAGGEGETIVGMGLCSDVIPVNKGDNLTIQAFFDLEKHPARLNPTHGGAIGAMATTTMYFAPKNNMTNAVWLDFEDDEEDTWKRVRNGKHMARPESGKAHRPKNSQRVVPSK